MGGGVKKASDIQARRDRLRKKLADRRDTN
jgi:hypothetical protein